MEKNFKQRISYSAKDKRKALIEISENKNANEIIKSHNKITDKKYSSKLFHKWKKEYYSKKPDLYKNGFNNDFSNIDIEYELKSFENENFQNIDLIYNSKKNNKEKKIEQTKEGCMIYSDNYLLFKGKNKEW